MKKKSKINFNGAANMIAERLECAFRAKMIDEWQRGTAGAILAFELPLFSNSTDVLSEAALCIASAKYRGQINDGAVCIDDSDNVIVKLF